MSSLRGWGDAVEPRKPGCARSRGGTGLREPHSSASRAAEKTTALPQRAPGEEALSNALTVPAGRSATRQFLLGVATNTLRPVMIRRARRLLATYSTRRIHLGCGNTLLPGWLNVDLLGRVPADVGLDMKKPLPFADASVDAIFTEHMVEHLTYTESLALVCECERVLRPGGVLRIVVPDFELYVRSYMGENEVIQALPPRLTPLLGLASTAYGSAHRSIWDAETLNALLSHAGLTATRSRFGESRIQPCPDTPERQIESLYVEAVKEQLHTGDSSEANL